MAVTLVAVLALGVALYRLTAGSFALEGGEADRRADGISHLAFGLGVLVASVGAFWLRPWGWTAFMTWAVIGLTDQSPCVGPSSVASIAAGRARRPQARSQHDEKVC